MKILTANIACGFKGMDCFAVNIKHHLNIHGLGFLIYEAFPTVARLLPVNSKRRRVVYIERNKYLAPVFNMIQQTAPDVLVLNEVLYEECHDEVERELHAQGFQTMLWGIGAHHPGASISTLVATREFGESIVCHIPQMPSMGGGAGMAGIRLFGKPLSVFGAHLAYHNQPVFQRQLKYIRQVARTEQSRGNEVLLAGDFNESEDAVCSNADFKALNLISADAEEKKTCPSFLPDCMQKSLDHIFIPSHFCPTHSEVINFGSDHLALCAQFDM